MIRRDCAGRRLSRARAQIPAEHFRRADRAGGDGAYAHQRHRHRPHCACLHPHRGARRRQDDDRPHPRPGAQLRRTRRQGHADHQPVRSMRSVPRHRRGPPCRCDGDGCRDAYQVEEMRELLDGVRYRPVSARFKIYIIDEVHMLSGHAFNALLKTLEEPPADVKFIFATTEIHKVPITVLSRCQRFALGGGAVGESAVREMLGVADSGLVFDVPEAVLKGDAPDALRRMTALYEGGADPVMVLQDLLELVHFLTRLKIVPSAGEEDPALEGERGRGLDLAQKLGTPVLARAWQMLLKGIAEAQTAPSALQAAEMVLVRLAYVADLPAPADLVKQLSSGRAGPSASVAAPRTSPAAATPAPVGANGGPRLGLSGDGGSSAAPRLAVREESDPAPALPQPQSFLEVIELFDKYREAVLRTHLHAHVHLVHFEPGRIEFRPAIGAPRDLANRLGKLLGEWTGTRWVVSISGEEGAPTLREQAEVRALSLRNEAAQHPLVRAVLETFPGARIEAVRELGAPEPAAEAEPPDSAEERSEGDDFR